MPAHRGPVLHDHVPGQSGVVDDDDLVTDHAVVGDVARGHDEAAPSDPRVVPLVGRAVHGDVFADGRVLPDGHPHGQPGPELQVLRLAADDGAMAHAAARPQGHPALEHDVRSDLHFWPDPGLRADHTVGPDPHTAVELGARVDHRGWVNARGVSHGRVLRAHALASRAPAPCGRAPGAGPRRPRSAVSPWTGGSGCRSTPRPCRCRWARLTGR